MLHLNLSDCIWVKDSTVENLSKTLPKLVHLDLSSCYLVTDEGIEKLFNNCRDLQVLKLENLTDVVSPKIDVKNLSLSNINLLNTNINDEGFYNLFSKSPFLQRLSISCTNLSNNVFEKIKDIKKSLRFISITNTEHLEDEYLLSLVHNNPFINTIKIIILS